VLGLFAELQIRSALDSQESNAAAPRCTTKLKNAHGTESRELLYRWHPWFGLRVGVHDAIGKSDGIVFRCNLSGSDTDRWLEFRDWTFDRSACARVREAVDANAGLSKLGDAFASVNPILLTFDQLLGKSMRGAYYLILSSVGRWRPFTIHGVGRQINESIW
jgi:hypothetical protein